MNKFLNPTLWLLLLICLSMAGCKCDSQQDDSSTLILDNSSITTMEDIFPTSPAGKLIEEHIRLSMGSGLDAEAIYQKSLTNLRGEKEAAPILFDAYKKVALENYLYRTMIVEALKQLHSEESLQFLNEIASDKIPADRSPENAEIDTRQDEVVIRITAVEGISLLAADSIIDAERSLIQLIGHDDLTVRQMATRGYLQSPFGNVKEKMQELLDRLPKEEHWYVTNEVTDIKKVAHPAMPEKFDFPINKSNQSPKIKE